MPGSTRQTRRPHPSGGIGQKVPGQPGIGVDAAGGAVIDPTENVLALVDAQARFQGEKDALTAKLSANESAWVIKYFEALMAAERTRVNDLASQKSSYDKQIAETQTTQLKTTSDLVSTQLDKVTDSLSGSLNKTADNIIGILAGLTDRLSKVEQFRYETGGKSSVSDPALMQIVQDITTIKTRLATGEGAKAGIDTDALSRHAGNQNIIGIWGIAIGVLIAIVSNLHLFIK